LNVAAEGPLLLAKMSITNLFGWVLMTLGGVLWTYGYFFPGHPSVVEWNVILPNWLAEFLPNIESEIGIAAMLGAIVPAYYPRTIANAADRAEDR